MSQTRARHPGGSELAHPDSVTPSAPRKYEMRHTSLFIILAVNNEKLFAQSEGGTDAPT